MKAKYLALKIFVVLITIGFLQPVQALDFYWVGFSGDWSDHQNHWATTSGGSVFHVTVPSPFDNVIFDANSFTFNDTVFIDTTVVTCKSIDWSAATFNPMFTASIPNATLKIYGSMTLSPNMDFNSNTWPSYDFIIVMESTSAGETLLTADHNVGYINFNGIGGEWSLLDSLRATNIAHSNGTLRTNGYTINAYTFSAYGDTLSTLDLDTSVINLTNSWNGNGLGYTLDADSAVFYIGYSMWADLDQTFFNVTFSAAGADLYYENGCSFNDVTFLQGGYMRNWGWLGGPTTFNNVLFQGWGDIEAVDDVFNKIEFYNSTADIDGNIYVDTLIFNNPGSTVTLGALDTVFVNGELTVNGSCSGLIPIVSSTPGIQAHIYKSTGSITVDYLLLQDINATGGAVFTANNSTAVSNVTGWTVNAPTPQILYWVGFSGDWNDPNHWSTSSGGSGGSCVPTPFDDVIFDANSFTFNDTVFLNLVTNYCHNMDWSAATFNPMFTASIPNATLKIYGSMTLSPNMDFNSNTWPSYDFIIVMESTSAGETLLTADHNVGYINFNGIGGEWSLLDSLRATNIAHSNGTLRTNGYTINAYTFSAYGDTLSTLDLDTSVINLTNSWNGNGLGYTLDADSAVFYIGYSMWADLDQTFFNVTFSAAGADLYYENGCSFNDVTFLQGGYMRNWGWLGGPTTFNNVLFQGWGDIEAVDDVFNKIEFYNSTADIDGNIYVDTLIFNNPGSTVTLGALDTVFVNGELVLNGLSSFPIDLQSSSFGVQAHIFKATDSVCSNFLQLNDINATGGASFFAGVNSADISNNTGWIFDNCAALTSDVWPGDVNYDLIADNVDIIYLGMAYGETGTVRSGASLAYTAQPSLYWLSQFQNLVNTNNADCDGNGIVNMDDTLGVSLNYGQTHLKTMPPFNQLLGSDPDLYFEMPVSPIAAGSSISIPIKLGTSTNLADSVYGLAFTIEYNIGEIDPASISLDYNGSWIDLPANLIHLEKNFQGVGEFDVGFARINQTEVSGFGTIANLSLVLDSGVTGSVSLTIKDVTLMKYDETVIPVNLPVDSIAIQCTSASAGYNFNVTDFDVSFTSAASNNSSNFWDFGDGQTDTVENPTHSYANPGTYTVCQTVSNSCGSDTICQNIVINCAGPTANYTYSTTDFEVTFTSLATNFTSIFWDFGDFTTDTAANPTHTYPSNGTYTVCQTVINACGSDTICQDIQIVVIGVESLIAPSVNISPNPSSGKFILDFSYWNQSSIDLEVRNILGVLVYSEQNIKTQGTNPLLIDLEHLPKGVYFLQIASTNVKQTQKLVIE